MFLQCHFFSWIFIMSEVLCWARQRPWSAPEAHNIGQFFLENSGPETAPYWCCGCWWRMQIPGWGLWNLRLWVGRGGEASLIGAVQGNTRVNRADGGTGRWGSGGAERGRREREDEAPWAPFLIIRMIVGHCVLSAFEDKESRTYVCVCVWFIPVVFV